MKMKNGAIIAGKSISNVNLNITKEELIFLIGKEYEESKRNEKDITIAIENAEFWITSDNKLHQITVWGDFEGKYKEIIGIGSTLQDVKKYVGNYNEENFIYGVENDEGICFELGDTEDDDDWDELVAQIAYISVYR